MECWGEVLWDRHDLVVSEVQQSRRDLERFYGEFFIHRSRIEEEYDRNSKSLIQMFSTGGNSQIRSNVKFRWIYLDLVHLCIHKVFSLSSFYIFNIVFFIEFYSLKFIQIILSIILNALYIVCIYFMHFSIHLFHEWILCIFKTSMHFN